MGSFNTTCFASNQTIASGDKARVVAVLQQHTFKPVELTFGDQKDSQYGVASSQCYPSSHWRPITVFIPAKYEDYGQFIPDMDSGNARAMVLNFYAELWNRAAVTAAGENPYHDKAFDFKGWALEKAPKLHAVMTDRKAFADDFETVVEAMTPELLAAWEYITDTTHEHRLFLRSYTGALRPLQFACLHEEAYQGLIRAMEATKEYGGKSNAMPEYIKRCVEEARSFTKEHYSKDKEDKHDMTSFFFAEHLAETLNRMAGGDSNLVMSRRDLHTLARVMADKLLAGDEFTQLFIEVVTPLMGDRYAFGALEMLGLHITPMVYAGQDYDNSTGRAYAKFIADVSPRVTKLRKDR